jgi:hypothetical protein
MLRSFLLAISFFLTLLLPSSWTVAQTPTAPAKTSLSSLSQPARFSSPAGNFSVWAPQKFDLYFDVDKGMMGKDGRGLSITWNMDEGGLSVTTYSYTKAPAANAAEIQQFLRGAVEGLVGGVKGKPVSEKDIMFGAYPGKEVDFSLASGGYGLARIFLAGQESYAVSVYARQTISPEARALLMRSLNSFDLIVWPPVAPSKVPATTLPQIPWTDRGGSDAKDAGLNGSVKTVVEENEAKGKREKTFSSEYNERGDLTEETSFPSGDRTIYGYVDKMRVSISIQASETGRNGGVVVVGSSDAKPGVPLSKLDLRYETRHEYRYDDRGRMIEESWFDNRGVLIFRSKFSYDDNVVTFARNHRDGEIYAKGKYILDEKGRHITEIDGQASEPFYRSTDSYEYLEFDAQGNWTKRALKGKYGNDRETVSTFTSMQYRTITYYP